ncbi:MAG: thioesterase, partial [Actinomycetota bacterium]|nr:thioesterase [Actinomycetota bacterium]
MKKPLVVEKIAVRYQDLDPYGHVNNAVHLQFFEAARIAYLE